MLLIAFALRRWRLGLVLLASVLVTVGPLGLRVAQRAPVRATDDDSTLTVLSCNLLYGTADAEPLLAWITEIDPDVIMFQEYADPWPGIVARNLQDRYPHVWQEPGGAHGQATLSRMPFVDVVPDIWERVWKVPSPRVGIRHEGKRVDITNVHVYPPMRFVLLQAQLDQIQRVADDAFERLGGMSGEPRADGVLYVGDFNAPWNSNHLRPLARVGLWEAHARVGTDRGVTWGPPDGLLSYAPGIRIDNAVYGGELKPVWSVVGPDAGSDHRPIAVGFRWRDDD
ncbi:MAG: endonuclease/exonuclease/phosphatase family protein [Phycisphaera sp.]|nr:MAG: endonuclease/exonuclease/phosphatase family protein [Phycisphaera sp.]